MSQFTQRSHMPRASARAFFGCGSVVIGILLLLLWFGAVTPWMDMILVPWSGATIVTGYKASEAQAARASVRGYLRWTSDVPIEFTERERVHMQDVRGLLLGVVLIGMVLLFGGVTVVYTIHTSRALLWRSMARVGGWGLVVVAVAGIFTTAAFDMVFIWMHRILFQNDFWLLDPEIHALIRLYPPEYFERFAALYGCLVLLLLLVVWGMSRTVSRRSGMVY